MISFLQFFSTLTLNVFLFPPFMHIPGPSNSPLLYHPNNMGARSTNHKSRYYSVFFNLLSLSPSQSQIFPLALPSQTLSIRFSFLLHSVPCILIHPSFYYCLLLLFITGPTTNTARLSPRYKGKTRGCHCNH